MVATSPIGLLIIWSMASGTKELNYNLNTYMGLVASVSNSTILDSPFHFNHLLLLTH